MSGESRSPLDVVSDNGRRRLHLREVTVDDPGPAPGYTGVGVDLYRARRDRHLDPATVAQRTRIQRKHIEALESGRFDELPGTAYAVGFLRSYAEFLGLDGEEIVRRFRDEVAGAQEKPELVFPEPMREARVPSLGVVALASFAALVIYGIWYFASLPERPVAAPQPAPPPVAAAPIVPPQTPSQPAPSVPPPQAQSQPAPAMPAPGGMPAVQGLPPVPALQSQTGTAAAPAAAMPAPNAPPAALPPSGVVLPQGPAPAAGEGSDGSGETDTPPEGGADDSQAGPAGESETAQASPRLPQVYGSENTNARIRLKANGDSWVQIVDPQNNVVMMRVMRAGDSYFVPVRPGLRLTTGSAGALVIELDGKNIGSLGAVGDVRRDIPLDPEKLRAQP